MFEQLGQVNWLFQVWILWNLSTDQRFLIEIWYLDFEGKLQGKRLKKYLIGIFKIPIAWNNILNILSLVRDMKNIFSCFFLLFKYGSHHTEQGWVRLGGSLFALLKYLDFILVHWEETGSNLHITYLHIRNFTLAAVREMELREIKPERWRSISCRKIGKKTQGLSCGWQWGCEEAHWTGGFPQ